MSSSQPSVGVVVVTYRARTRIGRCLAPIMASPLKPRVLVTNSSSRDGTVEIARTLGADAWVQPRCEFNHGLTRETARKLIETDIVVMLCPDVVAQGDDFLEVLTRPIRDGEAAVAYARQGAPRGADRIARCAREFNYPAESQLRGKEDRARLGAYTHFCSNACAAWSNAALDRIGGFKATLVSEETIAAAELLERGERIAYVAEAVATHGHPTRLLDSFRRQFDIGYSRELFARVLLAHEADEVRGRAYARALLTRLAREAPYLLPYALLDTAARLLGYRLGRLGPRLSDEIARKLSGQDFFWSSSARAQVRGLEPAAA